MSIVLPSSLDSLGELSALQQAQAIRERRISSEELVTFYLKRIERLNSRYQAFTEICSDNALAEARRKDRRRVSESRPPFHGVPVAVKDLHLMRGEFTRMGSRAFPWLWSPFDDVTVRTLRRAGFVLLGKTSTSELALMPIVEPDTHAPTCNPWNTDRTAGGSSGGAAAAVCAGLLPLAPGSDGAGSIRIPAALCGLVGLKPSRALVPNPHARFDNVGMTAIGPIARDVDDAAALLDALIGSPDQGPNSFLERARARPPRMTIGVVTQSPFGETEPECAAAVEEAGRVLESLGHRVVSRPGARATLDEFMPIYQSLLAAVPVLFESRLQPLTRWFRAAGRTRSQAEVRRLVAMLTDRALESFGDVDVVLTPTTPIEAPRVGAFRELPPESAFRAAAPLGAFTATCNLTGAPGLTLPWALSKVGLPLGVQLIGRIAEDARVLSLGRELEQRRLNPPGKPRVE